MCSAIGDWFHICTQTEITGIGLSHGGIGVGNSSVYSLLMVSLTDASLMDINIKFHTSSLSGTSAIFIELLVFPSILKFYHQYCMIIRLAINICVIFLIYLLYLFCSKKEW